MQLTNLEQEFVLHFGEMGSRWGINRTVGQIYALLFLSETPLNAEDIVERLGFSRSNVSMGLKELQAWKLVRLKHVPGDRRDYFTTPEDLWEIVRTLVNERKKREIDPTLTKLRELELTNAQQETEETPSTEALKESRYAQERISELRELIELLTGWYDDMNKLETERLAGLLALGSKIQGFVGKAESILPLRKSRQNKT
ncbi:MAG: GbsR/MarR family transcriptional regulator [Pseudomonadota bacterium]